MAAAPDSAADSERAAAAHLSAYFDGVEALNANFKQVVMDEDGSVLEEGEGELWLQRPGQFRWDYATPIPQQIVSDGETVWLYDIELDQVTRQEYAAAAAGSPMMLLSRGANVSEYFAVVEETAASGNAVFALSPLDAESVYRDVRLVFADGDLAELELFDQLGQHVRLSFSQLQYLPNAPADTFRLDLPPGVDIVDAPLPIN